MYVCVSHETHHGHAETHHASHTRHRGLEIQGFDSARAPCMTSIAGQEIRPSTPRAIAGPIP